MEESREGNKHVLVLPYGGTYGKSRVFDSQHREYLSYLSG